MGTSSFAGTDWGLAAESIAIDGWVRLRDALSPERVVTLRDADRPPWRELPPEEGVVHQSGFGSWVPLARGGAEVRQIGNDLVSMLSTAAQSQGHPALPGMNEADWTCYPEGTGHITAHRDPAAYVGIIAIFTLFGSATFRILTPGADVKWKTEPGDAVILRGHGWPTPGARRPVHAVEAPLGGDRLVLTMRCNSRGPGGGYHV